MNDPATLESVLQNAIGLTLGRQRQAIIDLGFNTCNGLENASKDDLKTLFLTVERNNRDLNANQQVRFNITVKARINALREEFIMRKACNAEMTLADLLQLGTADVDSLLLKHRTWEETKNAASSLSLPDITVPKLTKLNWKEFHQAFKELLSRQRGVNSIPLTYVIREHDRGNYSSDYESTEKQLINCIQLSGQNYNSDRETVFSLLLQYTRESEAESIVDQFRRTRNGRSAYRGVMAHMESTSYMDNLKSAALTRIRVAHYDGEKKDFGIAKYFAIHSNAHNDLEVAGEPMSNGMKITNFLSGIKDPTALNYAVTTKGELGVQTFEQFYNSFSAKLSTHITLTSSANAGTNSSRQISAMFGNHNGNNRGSGRNGRGRGGRGRGRGRNGRGRGYRGGFRGGRGRNSAHQWVPEYKDYSIEEWQSLSNDQQQRVKDLRRAMRQFNQTGDHSTNGHGNERHISATGTSGGADGSESVPSQVNIRTGQSISGTSGRVGDLFASRQGSTSGQSRTAG